MTFLHQRKWYVRYAGKSAGEGNYARPIAFGQCHQVDTQNVDGLFAKNTKQFSLCVVLHNLLKFLLAEAGSGCQGRNLNPGRCRGDMRVQPGARSGYQIGRDILPFNLRVCLQKSLDVLLRPAGSEQDWRARSCWNRNQSRRTGCRHCSTGCPVRPGSRCCSGKRKGAPS